MIGRRLTRFVFFFLELPRFAAVAALVSALGRRQGWTGSLEACFAAPQVLFVLMALLFWIDDQRYGAYKPLFAAGKAVSAVAAGAALGAALPTIAEAAALSDETAILGVIIAVSVLAYDFLVAAVVLFSCLKTYLSGGESGSDERPELVVDVLPDEKGEA